MPRDPCATADCRFKVNPEFTIVVPSRKRAHNMALIRELLPSAVICVDEREVEDYADLVPQERLLLHPPMEIAARVRNWLIEEVSSLILVMIDDDFQGVMSLTGSKRFITDAEEIYAIIENAARACVDLELTTFCFAGSPNAVVVKPEFYPVKTTQPVFRVFGIMGAARRRKWRTDLPGRSDVDWTLRTLLLDRCVYADVRFYFDCGRVFSGRGGNVGLVTPEAFDRASRELRRTWGRSISFKMKAYEASRSVANCAIKVSRTNKSAHR